MLKFYIFRIHLFFPSQLTLPSQQELTRQNIILQSILRLYLESDVQLTWKIGNVLELGTDFVYFRIGRKTKRPFADYVDKNFTDDIHPDVYSNIFIDTHNEVCAIQHNPLLSQTTTVANKLAKLMAKTDIIRQRLIKVKIQPMVNPSTFLDMLNSAHKVTNFWCSFPRKNAFDVEEDIIKPGQRAMDHALAEKGKVQLFGYELSKQYLEELTRSVSTLGEQGGAHIVEIPGKRGKNITFKKNPITMEVKSISDVNSKTAACVTIREIYEELRHGRQ